MPRGRQYGSLIVAAILLVQVRTSRRGTKGLELPFRPCGRLAFTWMWAIMIPGECPIRLFASVRIG